MKKIVILAIATVLVLSTGVALAVGPAEKATGYVRLNGWAEGWYAQFNAHEETDSRPAKGNMRVWHISGRALDLDVWYVLSEGEYAWFAAVCTYDSSTTDNREGRWLCVKVHDGGTPGSNGDEIGWTWKGTDSSPAQTFVSGKGDPSPYWTTVVEGNLVVHTYD